MRISSMFQDNKTVFSFEVFPPKKTTVLDNIREILFELKELSPDFISVTYGAAGSTTDMRTALVSSIIKDEIGIEPLSHITSINSNKEEVKHVLDELKSRNIQNILALRGDRNDSLAYKSDFNYASDLISFVKEKNDFYVSAACYPENHIDSKGSVDEILNLRKKMDLGAEHLVSQLFFDNSCFYDFIEKTKIAGIDIPIQAGIMPVVNTKQINRIIALCGSTIPPKFIRIMEKYEHNPEALRDAGIAYAVDQIVDLISNNVAGIHLYTMNNPYIAKKISESISSLL